ncbi:MKI67 FHA domain-interacting nucleolar phosphoprotein [Glycine soja]
MGKKAKKAMKKNLKRASFNKNPSEDADFLPLEGGPARKLAGQQKPPPPPPENTATVLYVGRIPHGFYEKEMEGYFGQFGTIKRLRIARNKKSGKSRHFGFIEFESPEVAKIVADTMHNYLLFEHLLQVYVIPPEHVHPRIWRGFNYHYKPLDSVQIERKRHDKVSRSMNKKDRTLEEHKKLVEKVLKHDQKRRKRIEAAGIDYECPEIVGNIQPAPKKIKFED